MRIVVVGATGTIGKPVTAALQSRHEIVKVGNKGGEAARSDSIRTIACTRP